jgi:hypothetical protein
MEDIMSDGFDFDAFDIVCTGKGTHKRTRLTKFTFHKDGTLHMWRISDSFHPAESEHLETLWTRSDGQPNEVFVKNCPRCGRNPELTPEKFQHLLVALLEKGISRLDISMLPF